MFTTLVTNTAITGNARVACIIGMVVLAVLIVGVLLPMAIREGNRVAAAEAAEAAALGERVCCPNVPNDRECVHSDTFTVLPLDSL